MPTQTLSLSDLQQYGEAQEKEEANPFHTGEPQSLVMQKQDGKSKPTPVQEKQTLTLKDLELFGSPGTKVEKGAVDPTSSSPGDFGRGVINNLPLIGSVAATMFAPEATLPAMALAGAGGASGYLARDLYKPAHDGVGSLLKDAAIEGGVDALGEGAGRLLNKPLAAVAKRFTPESLVESSIMPQTSLPLDKRDRIVQKMLKEREISPDAQGYKDVLRKVGRNNQDVKLLVKGADGLVADVDPTGPTFKRNIVQLKKTFRTQADPKADLKVIRGAVKRWEDRFGAKAAVPATPLNAAGQPLFNNGQPITTGSPAIPAKTLLPSQAQELKQGTYRMNRKKYGQLGTAQDEFEKTVARGLAEDIVSRVPAVGPINKDSSEFLELSEQLRRFVGREGNKRLVGLKAMIAAHGVISEDFARAALETGAVAIDNPHVKVALARVLDSARTNVAGRAVASAAPYALPTATKAVFGGRDGILAPRSDVDSGK